MQLTEAVIKQSDLLARAVFPHASKRNQVCAMASDVVLITQAGWA